MTWTDVITELERIGVDMPRINLSQRPDEDSFLIRIEGGTRIHFGLESNPDDLSDSEPAEGWPESHWSWEAARYDTEDDETGRASGASLVELVAAIAPWLPRLTPLRVVDTAQLVR